MQKLKKNISLELEHHVYTKQKGNRIDRIYLLLHGYLLTGDYLLKELEEVIPTNSLIISPNAPLPVPVKKREKHVVKYAWYFFDSHTKQYYIDFELATKYIENILKEYTCPITVIGYSQGGYLAPKIAESNKYVDHVVGLCCAFRNSRFEARERVFYHQILSKLDLLIDFDGSYSEFTSLMKRGVKGEFITLENSGHRLDEHYKSALEDLILIRS